MLLIFRWIRWSPFDLKTFHSFESNGQSVILGPRFKPMSPESRSSIKKKAIKKKLWQQVSLPKEKIFTKSYCHWFSRKILKVASNQLYRCLRINNLLIGQTIRCIFFIKTMSGMIWIIYRFETFYICKELLFSFIFLKISIILFVNSFLRASKSIVV